MDGKRWSGEGHWITTYQGCISFTSAFLPLNPVSKWLCRNSWFSTSKQIKKNFGKVARITKRLEVFTQSFFLNFPAQFCRHLKNFCLSFSMNCTEVLCKVDGAREGLEGRHGKFWWKGLEMEGDMKWWRVDSNRQYTSIYIYNSIHIYIYTLFLYIDIIYNLQIWNYY